MKPFVNEKLDEFNKFIKGKRVAILGIGVSNLPLLEYFIRYGSELTVFDNKEESKVDEDILDKLKINLIKYHFGENSLSFLKDFDIIFRSPSIRPDEEHIQAELDKGAILTSEIEMVMKLSPGTVIGITGSDGKTTTTSLIYEILKENGYNCFLGGNIGIPLFTKIQDMRPEDYIVLELSSFQLMNIKTSPNISVITNISPNHLDIHKSYEEYINSKEKIFEFQNEDSITVLNYDNEITRKIANKVKGKVIFFSKKEKLNNGVIYDNKTIKISQDNIRRHVIETKDILIRGEHNYENICTAVAATINLVSPEVQKKAIMDFKGVEHRLEFVKEINEIKWYNDSIGTSPSRTIAGLNAFDEKIVLIAGGYDKHLDYTPIAAPIIQNVSKLILMGATANKIEKAVIQEAQKQNKRIPIYHCENLQEVVETAYDVAIKGEVVLFSPASASFDLFKNFAQRGEMFKEIVNRFE